jgi:hypothetical protein
MNINTWYEVEDDIATEINYVYIISYNDNVTYYYVTFEDTESEYYVFNKIIETKKNFSMYLENETWAEVDEKYLINKCFKG